MNQPVITLNQISKSYSDKQVLNQLSGEVKQGQIIGLLGRNGAGKTTLLEAIMGLKSLDQGEITIWQKELGVLSELEKQKIGFVPQDSIGFEWMKVSDYLNYFGGFFSRWDRSYSNQLIARWQINPKQRIADLSGGQQQILQVIQALSIKPELLILDEPVAHLDPNMRRQFLAELVDLTCELGSTTIFSTHIVSDLERVASHIALLNHGRIDHFYELEELKHSAAQLIFDSAPNDRSAFPQLINWTELGKGAKCVLARPDQHLIERLSQQANVSFTTQPLTLEDWYLEVTNETNT